MLKRLHHVGIVVDDLADAKHLLGVTLGLRLVRELEVPLLARRVAFFEVGDAEIEVIEDLDADARQRTLSGASARIEHVAIEVDSVESVLAGLEGLGVKTDSKGIVRVGSRLNAWTDPSTSDGIMFQLVSSVPDRVT
jgi:catechol 2,3-dioxygenase-like lactoylglutathione lyase family enzyme